LLKAPPARPLPLGDRVRSSSAIMTRKPLPTLVAALASFGLLAAFSSSALADDAPTSPESSDGKGEKVVAQAAPAAGSGGGTEAPVAAPTGGPAATPAVAGGEGIKDNAAEKTEEKAEEQKKNPFAGSIFLFDQSATTNSFSKGSQQSYSPSYEWWLSPRVYYTVADHFKFGARFDFFKEFTNHEETTEAREWRPGDPWLTAAYGNQASFLNKHEKSRYSLGVIFRPPLSKESRANGQYFAFGPSASISWGFDVAGSKSKVFQSASFGLYASYSHAFTQYTTPSPFNGFTQARTNQDGGVILDSQVRSGTLAGNSLIYSVNGAIDILENLSYGASMIWIDQFSYRPPDATFNGTTVARNENDTRFRQLTWFLTSFDYDPIKELSVSVGYYNLANSIGPDGQRRNVLWSPDARVFFSLTAHLDAIMDDVTKPKTPKANTAIANFRSFQ
jgi:hypothetical protein